MFGFDMNTEVYTFEIYIGHALADTQQMHTIPIMAQQQYQSMCDQFSHDNRPIRVVVSKQEIMENGNIFNRKIEFRNHSYIKELGGFE